MGLKKNKNITHPEWKKMGFIGLIVETLKNAGKNKIIRSL
jgi:hypothetical protein